MQIFDLYRFFLACVGCVFGLAAVLAGAGKSTQKRDIQRALKFAADLGEAL
jgi:putative component of toxin-antitoxin plasmid stabilization module